tara:strand:+ start:555 stop:2516 length:1962 start_codon:yes stop_codon:yes gene_type:complete
MIDYTSYKKIYTAGEMFTLTASDFHGFAEIDSNGLATEVSTGKALSSKNTYATDLFFSNVYTDRVIADDGITLPNTQSECSFNLNDNFDYKLFQFKLDKLRENNTYVYSRLFIASNKLPYTDKLRYASVSNTYTTGFEIFTSDADSPEFRSNTKFADNNYLSAFGFIIDATAQQNNDFNDRFSLFACTSSNLICLTGSNTSIAVVEDTTGYESEDNDLAFNELGGIASTNKHLFLSDTGNNVVIRYDITGYSNNDSSLRNKRNFIEVLGGAGSGTRTTKFNRPTKLAASNGKVAVYDSGNKVVKLFTEEFNYITRITSIDFNKESMGSFGFDPDFGSLYIVTYQDVVVDDITSRTPFLYRFSGVDFRDKERVVLNDKLDTTEVIKDVTFSGTDSNFWYFSTNKTVYKKFKTRPAEVIGKFRNERLYLLNFTDSTEEVGDTVVTINNRWNFNDINFSQADFNWNLGTEIGGSSNTTQVNGLLDDDISNFTIFPSISSYDRAIMLTAGRLYFFDEPTHTAYQRVLKDVNYPNYGSEGFSLNSDSFIQQSVINTELFKVINDTLTIKNNVVGRFTGKYVNDILELDNYDYNVDFDKFLIQEIENLYVHANEENLTSVLNRCFDLVYDLQGKLINFVKPGVDSKVQPSYTVNGIIEI